MKILIHIILFILTSALPVLNCSAQKKTVFKPGIVYKSDGLIITQISENTFEHTSFLQTDDFGNVPCNGLVVRDNTETIVFDTPTNDKSSAALINWIQDTLHCSINAVIPTHFHNDCLGGLKTFHENKITSYAYFKTIAFATENNSVVPQHSFNDSLILHVGNKSVSARFFGEGHTRDNVAGYFPAENIMFGGCLIKELNAGKGYLGDANVAAWPVTVKNIKQAYPDVKIVIPGHGQYGNKKLLDYTIQLFKAQ